MSSDQNLRLRGGAATAETTGSVVPDSMVAHGGFTARKLYFSFVKAHKWTYVGGILTVLITNITEVSIPRLIQWSIDIVAGKPSNSIPAILSAGSSHAALNRITIGFLIIMVVGWVMRILWRQLLARRTHLSGQVLRSRLWDTFRYMPLNTFERFSLGDMMNRSTSDVNSGRFVLGFTLVQTSDIIFFSALSLVMMFSIDWQLAAFCTIAFPIIPFFIIPLSRREYQQHAWAQEKLSSFSDLMTQSLVLAKLQRATALEENWNRRLEGESKEYTRRRFAVIKTGWKIFPFGASPTIIAYGILTTLGVQKIQAGNLSLGEFVALLSYVLMLQQPLFEMSDCIAEWQKGLSSLNRIAEMLNIQSGYEHGQGGPEHQTISQEQGAPAIDIRHLSFAFDPQGAHILRDISLTLHQGGMIGMTGEIGAGKSTLLSIIAGLQPAYQGSVKIFGHDLGKIGRREMAEWISYVPQVPFLFAGSVRYNLCLDKSFGDEELWSVLDVVGLAEDFKRGSDGLDTWIGEWGINLSGGQKQRMTLARALLRPRPILLLDDCLSAVDAITEEKIICRIRDKLRGQAVIWVAHRISTLKNCERVFLMSHGQLRVLDEKGQV